MESGYEETLELRILELDTVVHTCSHSTWDAEAKGSQV